MAGLRNSAGDPTGEVGMLSPAEPHGRRLSPSWAPHRWHVDGANMFPNELSAFDDVATLFRGQILPGHLPPAPPLRRDDGVIAFGSCFADDLRRALESAGFPAGSVWVPPGLNNTFALLDFMSWCVTGEATALAYRYERGRDGEIHEWTPAVEREKYRASIEAAGAFVFTLGLAEVWTDRQTGQVFWRGVPEHIFDQDRHHFRTTSVDENADNLCRMIELIRLANATAPIVLTVSPVPLGATFRDISCLTADCVSKSTLRVAVDAVVEARPEGVYYWPSFELVRWAGAVFDWRAYAGDSRHAHPYLVRCVVDAFAHAYYAPDDAAVLRARLAESGILSVPRYHERDDLRAAGRLPRAVASRWLRALGR